VDQGRRGREGLVSYLDLEAARETSRRTSRRFYHRNVLAGLCPCGRKPKKGGRTCRRCLAQRAARAGARGRRWATLGLCAQCGRARFHSAYCEKHLQVQHLRSLRRRVRGVRFPMHRVCSVCGMAGHNVLRCAFLSVETKVAAAVIVRDELRRRRRDGDV